MQGINISKFSAQLRVLVSDKVVNNSVDCAVLENIKKSPNVSKEILNEIDALLYSALNGDKVFGDIGDIVEIHPVQEKTADKFTPQFNEIFNVSDDFKVDESIFTADYWKKLFPEDSYEYKQSDSMISIYGADAFIIIFTKHEKNIDYNDLQGNKYTVWFNDNNRITKYTSQDSKNNLEYDFEYPQYSKTFSTTSKNSVNNQQEFNIYKKDGELVYSEVNGVIKDKFADKIISDLEKIKPFNKNNKDIIDQIDYTLKEIQDLCGDYPISNLMEQYYKKTGKNLLNELKSRKLENLYKRLVDILSSRTSTSEIYIEYLKKNIEDCLKKRDIKDLAYDFQIINPRYMSMLLAAFKGEHTEKIYPDIIANAIGESYVAPMSDEYLAEKVEPAVGLISLINESGLSRKQKLEFINLILKNVDSAYDIENFKDILNINTSIISTRWKYVDDIMTDIQEHRDNVQAGSNEDIRKLAVDIRRLSERGKKLPFMYSSSITEPNGEFDVKFSQGNTGDCWLIAGIISIINHDNRVDDKDKILPHIVRQDGNGNYIVTLKGIGKEYVVTSDAIKKSKHLSRGEGDVRALEIAIDQYIKELAYDGINQNTIDINGNYTQFFYEVILGNGGTIYDYKRGDFDFNDPNMVYSFSPGDDIEPKSLKKAGTYADSYIKVRIRKQHAYAIVGSDDKYVYVVNPWDSSKKIMITWENFEKMNPTIYCANIK